ncbi:MAG: hypothetical protein IH589_09940 [Anaerolineales bacterium]|nr:hypothetical protein [Anaerolineales bacterium]
MKSQYRMLFAFAALLMSVSLACAALSPAEPTAVPTIPPPPTNVPLPTSDAALPVPGGPSNPAGGPAGNPQTSGSSSEMVTFVDENDLLAFELPGDWFYEHNTGDYLYVDTFTSPDETSAKIESLVYNDGTPFVKSQNGQFALYLLNTYYSYTGKVGDIRVLGDQIMNDGSERLEWTSKGGGYSGYSYFEIRGDDRKTFLMFTVWYINDVDQDTLDVVNNAVNTYYIP